MEFLYEDEEPYILSEEEKEDLNAKFRIYNRISANCSFDKAKTASKIEREFNGITDAKYTYGEINFHSLGEIFASIKARYGGINPNGKFYDLGSGSGKVVISAGILHNFDACFGLEYLESLYKLSLDLKSNYDQLKICETSINLPNIQYENVDMLIRG